MSPRWVLATALSLLVAGCSGAVDEEDPGNGTDPGNASGEDESTALEAPVWAAGYSWTWTSPFGPLTYVVTNASAEGYMMDVTQESFAWFHAREPVSLIGVTGADLSGSQTGGSVSFFKWPLDGGMSWSLKWDDQDWQAETWRLSQTEVQVNATNNAGELRQYTYDNDTQWFGWWKWFDVNGTQVLDASVSDFTQSFSGRYVRWQVDNHVSVGAGPFNTGSGGWSVTADSTDVWYNVTITCDPGGLEGDQGAFRVTAGPSGDPTLYDRSGQCPATIFDEGTLEIVEGDWSASLNAAGALITSDWYTRTLLEFGL